MDLDDIARRIEECTRCPLHKTRTLPVPGEGPDNARIVFVGEAPGREEDLSGRPFVGRAGKLLDTALERAGIKRDDVFITSVLKCRPPDNRTPRAGEIKACMPYLREQLETIKPDVVVTLGNVSLKALTGKSGITKLHGIEIPMGKYIVFPTYHPAAILRNPNLMETFIADLRKLKEV